VCLPCTRSGGSDLTIFDFGKFILGEGQQVVLTMSYTGAVGGVSANAGLYRSEPYLAQFEVEGTVTYEEQVMLVTQMEVRDGDRQTDRRTDRQTDRWVGTHGHAKSRSWWSCV
jgi:hypothetical protein